MVNIQINDDNTKYMSVHDAHKAGAIAKNVNPPILYRECRPDTNDTPYFFAYEGVADKKHYIYIGSFVGTEDYQYYCSEEDTYHRFSTYYIHTYFERYTKFVIYKYFE